MNDTRSIDINKFRYSLPESCIAKYPLSDRSDSNLLVYSGGRITHERFSDLSRCLPTGSWLVFNNTRVIQARLRFRKATGARIEIFCLEPVDPPDYEQSFQSEATVTWICLVGNAKKWKSGPVSLEITMNGIAVKLEAFLMQRSGEGFMVTFQWQQSGITFGEIIEHAGSTPIPPYLNREAEQSDRERYQTIYSRNNGSVAAPTAGLHFTRDMMAKLEKSGVELANLTLHVGAGTFVPVKEQNARDHSMHSELVLVRRSFLEQWIQKTEGLIAVGTTSTRSLESLYWLGVKLITGSNDDPSELGIDQWDHESLPQEISLTDSLDALLRFCTRHNLDQFHFGTRLMIVPGYRFRTISGLLTNFHMPGSTLLLLIAAWIGKDWKKVYDYALKENFRFLSYGDSSLLIP
jgi:S-adenosylmethionine:tRNA ribosyltransferase-isomerase